MSVGLGSGCCFLLQTSIEWCVGWTPLWPEGGSTACWWVGFLSSEMSVHMKQSACGQKCSIFIYLFIDLFLCVIITILWLDKELGGC